jgi:hypothetical protein
VEAETLLKQTHPEDPAVLVEAVAVLVVEVKLQQAVQEHLGKVTMVAQTPQLTERHIPVVVVGVLALLVEMQVLVQVALEVLVRLTLLLGQR